MPSNFATSSRVCPDSLIQIATFPSKVGLRPGFPFSGFDLDAPIGRILRLVGALVKSRRGRSVAEISDLAQIARLVRPYR